MLNVGPLLVRLLSLAVLAVVLFVGGYSYRGYNDAQRAASQAVQASVEQAKASQKRDTRALQDRSSTLTKTEPSLAALRGWQGGIKLKKEDAHAADETGAGCDSDPWGSPEYLRVLGDAVRAGNQALDTARDVRGAVQADPGP